MGETQYKILNGDCLEWFNNYYDRNLKKGEEENTRRYKEWVLNRLDKPYIPEQIFENEFQKSICPLVWAHFMFILNLSLGKI